MQQLWAEKQVSRLTQRDLKVYSVVTNITLLQGLCSGEVSFWLAARDRMARYESKTGWNISFAGCGYMGIYYIGVGSCLLERASYLLDDASKIGGSSSGALFGALVVCKVSLAKTCGMMLMMTKEARRRSISALHPTFNLLKVVRDFLEVELPDDAHLLASGRLHISLTRASDGQNVLVSRFASKEELIQALICSSFFPLYCGWMPPTYRDIRYVDGAISDNLPFSSLNNTITVAPFAGESDISPRENPFYYHEIHHSNVSIRLNLNNIYRVTSAFLPPEPQVLAQVCRDGYRDALRFLYENDLLKLDLLPELSSPDGTRMPMCRDREEQRHGNEKNDVRCNSLHKRSAACQHRQHWREETTTTLPAPVERVISKWCEERDGSFGAAGQLSLVKLLIQTLMLTILPVQWVVAFVYRMIEWAPEMCSDLQWLCSLAWELCKRTLSNSTNEGHQKSSADEQLFTFENLSKREISSSYPTPPTTPTLPAATYYPFS
ncbi:patatin-like phospholipase domain-containing protein 2 [Engraulis encrasicolus]|uniref:patatin-like phospholipase domain-containing protein 2 n=1 Tax=Engraulis encrasicolus TaxID=184585 RepID=UPI002FD51172